MTALDLPLLPEVEIPPGDPAVLLQASRTYHASSEQAQRLSQWVSRTAHTTVGTGWSGAASQAFFAAAVRVAHVHDNATQLLRDGAAAIERYAHGLEEAQRQAWQARQAAEEYNREATQLRVQRQAAAGDPEATAHIDARADQIASERSHAVAMSDDARVAAHRSAVSAAGAFGAVAQGAVGLVFPGASKAGIIPKATADSLLGLRKAYYESIGSSKAAAMVGSTDEKLARWLGFGTKLERFAPAFKVVGKVAPAVGGVLGLYNLVRPGANTEQRALGGVTAAAGGVLTASAFGAFAAGAATFIPVLAAGVLLGVAGYQLGKLVYNHWDDITWGLGKAWNGVAKAARWAGGKLEDFRDNAAKSLASAAGSVTRHLTDTVGARGGVTHSVTHGLGAVASAFGL